jgi:hypothetical protein
MTVENCGKICRSNLLPEIGRTQAASGILRGKSNCEFPQAVSACSACAGDYEDPDRTAWTPDADDDDGDEYAAGAVEEEFPAD